MDLLSHTVLSRQSKKVQNPLSGSISTRHLDDAMKTLQALAALFALCTAPAIAQTYPSTNFRTTHALSGLDQPTQVRFARDGRVFVAEKSGRLLMYANLLDPSPQVIADLSGRIHNYQDRGLLGLALDPQFPNRPWLYIAYSYNGGLFSDTPPRWPSDNCPDPLGSGAGCVISGRLSRLTLTGAVATDEVVLVEDWYQQFPSHSIGTVRFGSDGYLYIGGGDGARFNTADWGQHGNLTWPDQRSPLNQGGALRSQGLEVESLYTDQVWLNGTIARVDPQTGLGVAGNPLYAAPGASANAQRILAYGLRNPFRFTMRPGTSDVWVSDVGWNRWEEINVIPAPGKTSTLKNFGWPCFEGPEQVSAYSLRPLCVTLYASSASGGRTPASAPFYSYVHTTNSSISGISFYTGSGYPAEYRNALFFADINYNRIWAIKDTNNDGLPDAPANSAATVFAQGNLPIVDLEAGPAGDLFFADINFGRVSRISWDADTAHRNLAPSAAIDLATGSEANGPSRTISFTASNSIDPDSDPLSYAWDLDGDGAFDDATGITASETYTAIGASPATFRIGVRVTDSRTASDEAHMTITVSRDLLFADGFDPPEKSGLRVRL